MTRQRREEVARSYLPGIEFDTCDESTRTAVHADKVGADHQFQHAYRRLLDRRPRQSLHLDYGLLLTTSGRFGGFVPVGGIWRA